MKKDHTGDYTSGEGRGIFFLCKRFLKQRENSTLASLVLVPGGLNSRHSGAITVRKNRSHSPEACKEIRTYTILSLQIHPGWTSCIYGHTQRHRDTDKDRRKKQHSLPPALEGLSRGSQRCWPLDGVHRAGVPHHPLPPSPLSIPQSQLHPLPLPTHTHTPHIPPTISTSEAPNPGAFYGRVLRRKRGAEKRRSRGSSAEISMCPCVRRGRSFSVSATSVFAGT